MIFWILVLITVCETSESNRNEDYSSTVACFSGSGFVINRLTNRPITSTEEKVEIEFQTSLPDVHLFSAGSENQLLSLSVDNGWPTVSVQLPLLNAPGGSRAHPPGGHADEVNPEPPRLLHLDIHENPNLVYRTRLDDNQPHKLVLIRRNQMLSLTVDDLLVYYRPSAINKAATKLLRTRTIILGGPSTAAQGIQGPTDRVVFEGIFTRALFIADGLQMDLLKYTLTGQHGFRIVSASTETITTTTTPAYRVLFDHECLAHYPSREYSQLNRTSKSVYFSQNHMDEAYVHVTLSARAIMHLFRSTNFHGSALNFFDSGLRSTSLRIQPQLWNSLVFTFSHQSRSDGLLFLLYNQTRVPNGLRSGTQKPLTQKTLCPNGRYLAAEFRNQSLYLIIQKDCENLFELGVDFYISLPLKECGQPPFTLEIHYTVVWLRTPAGHFESWPVLRVRTSSTQRWMFIGPNSRIRPVYSMLEPSTLDQYLEQFERLEDGTYGFGRHLLIGGLNFTASIEEGDYFENLLTVTGTHRSFIGCIHSVMFNDIELDLRSAVQSRGRAGRKSKEFHQVVSVGCESCIGSVNSPANGENRQCSNGTPHSYFPAQRLDGWKEGCDCSGTMHEGPECDKDSKIYSFNGRQKVRFRFPTAQRSKADQLKFIFQTDVMNASIFEASLKTWTSDISKELREVYSNQSYQTEVKSCRQNNGNMFEVRLLNSHLEVKYGFLGTPQSFTLDPEVSDNLWHSFRLTRYGSSMDLELDGQMKTTNTVVKKSELVFNDFVIGADETCVISDDATTGDPIVRDSLPNFVGKLSRFEYNSFKFTENMKSSGSPNASSNRRSRWIAEADADVYFPSKSDVYNRETKSLAFPVMFQTQQCHLKLMMTRSVECLPIKFTFKTLQTNGVLVANYNRAQMTYFLIDLVNGELRFSFGLNKEAEETSTLEGSLNDGSWHTVEVTRSVESRDFISLYVDRGGSDERTMQMRISFGGERDHQMCGRDAYVGGVPDAVYGKMRPSTSFVGFKGCLAGLTLGNGQVLDLMKPAGTGHEDEEIKISCSKRLSPGCPDSPKKRCDDNLKEWSLNNRTLAGELPHPEDVSCCVNGGIYLPIWNEFHCACELTTFIGPHCSEFGTTVHFGMLERSPVHGNSDLGSAHHSLAEMVGYAQLRLDCKEELSFLSHLAIGFQFGSGVVNLGYLGRTPEHNRRSTLFYLQNVNDESSILQLYLDSGRLMLLHTTKKTETLIAGPADNRLDDGFYHRILLFQTRGDLLLEIDGNKSWHRLQGFRRDVIGGTQNIWLGHDPNSNQTDFFYGYLTGVYFNGKYLLDIIFGNNHLTSAQAISYGKVERVPKFIPRLVNGSQLQIKSTLSHKSRISADNVTQMLTTSTATTKPEISFGEVSIPVYNRGVTSSTATKSFARGKNGRLEEGHKKPVRYHAFLWETTQNMWLLVGLGMVGFILFLSSGLLLYRYAFGSLQRKTTRIIHGASYPGRRNSLSNVGGTLNSEEQNQCKSTNETSQAEWSVPNEMTNQIFTTPLGYNNPLFPQMLPNAVYFNSHTPQCNRNYYTLRRNPMIAPYPAISPVENTDRFKYTHGVPNHLP